MFLRRALRSAVAPAAALAATSSAVRSDFSSPIGCEQKYVGRFSGTEKMSVTADTAVSNAAVSSTEGKSAGRWSILSERIEGVAKELFLLIGAQDPYLNQVASAEGPIMQAIRKKMDSTDWDGLSEKKETMFAYGSEMSTDTIEAQFVKMMTFMKSPKRVLEVGMFAGYGAAAIIEALPQDGKLVSLDLDPFLKNWVEDVTSQFPEGKKLTIKVGPALDSIKTLPADEKFDLVFVDANKSEYKAYVQTLLDRDLLTKDAMLLVDNTLYCGYPYLPGQYDTQPKRRGFGDALIEFNEWVATHPELMSVIIPLRDGVTLVKRR